MASVALVLLLIMSIINVINYRNLVERSDAKINMILTGNGGFPVREDKYERTKGSTPPGAQPPFKNPDFMTKETPFNTRYFIATFDKDGNVTEIETEFIAALTEEESEALAKSILATGKEKGFTSTYRFMRQTEEDDSIQLIFLDCSEDFYSFKTFLRTTIIVSLIGATLVFLLVLTVSKIVVKSIAESYEKQKRFITDASHEIKTPLGIISANTEVMEMESGETEWTKSTRRQVERLTALTEKLVFLSRMEEEGTELNITEFSLSEALEDTVSAFLPVAEQKGLFLAADIGSEIRYKGDEAMIRQMFSLLTDNAIKYSKEKGTIKINMKENGKRKQITFWNSVEEIEKGDLSVLFERFYRKDSSRSTKTGGHGIGLSVVKEIVRAHKGKISAESKDGKSILFTIIL